jgi:hypothetical protein
MYLILIKLLEMEAADRDILLKLYNALEMLLRKKNSEVNHISPKSNEYIRPD